MELKTIKVTPELHRRLGIYKTTEGHISFDESIKKLLDKEATR